MTNYLQNKNLKPIFTALFLWFLGATNLYSQTAPTGAVDNGLFSVSDTKMIWFSRGNLQYKPSTNTWCIASFQYYYCGGIDYNNNNTYGNCAGYNNYIASNYTSYIDLFGWGTSGWNNGNTYFHPYDSNTTDSKYGPNGTYNLTGDYAQADWGVYNSINYSVGGTGGAGVWRLLTSEETTYLLFNRTTKSGIRYAKARLYVSNRYVSGLIILPDNWDSSTFDLNETNNGQASYTVNDLSSSDWNTLEASGAVFLPAAGYRRGTNCYFVTAGYPSGIPYGYYWTSSCSGNEMARFLKFDSGGVGSTSGTSRSTGHSVRLVRDASYSNIKVTISPSGSGTTTGDGIYENGSSCTLTATPVDGYRFVGWKKNGTQVSTTASYTFTISESGSYVAEFAKITYTINVSASPSAGGSVSGGGTYDQGSSCTLTATPASGYAFTRWTKNGYFVSSNPTYTFNVSAAGDYVANFVRTYSITASANPAAGGSVSGAGTYNSGSSCTLTATPASGYAFINWTKNGSQVSTNKTYTFTVSAAGDYVANFVQTYSITASASPSEGGNVSGAGTYNSGSSCTLTATPATGYNFTRWTKSGTQVSTNASYTFTVSASGSYVAEFTKKTYTISASASPSAGGTVSGAGTYEHGSSCSLTATPATGYHFVNWTVGGSSVSTNPTYTFTVTGTETVVANFAINSYSVTATANPTAGGTLSGAGSYNHGSSCTLKATRNQGYVFINWTKNGSQVSTNTTYTFTVTADGDYVANFNPTYSITASASPTAGGTVTGAGTYENGSSCTLTATPNTNYSFKRWKKNNTTVSTDPSFTFTVTEAGAYVAEFYQYSPLTFSYDNTNYTATVTGHQNGSSATGSLIIPSTVRYNNQYYTVTKIGSQAFWDHTGLTGSLTIPSTVTTIEYGAFRGCRGFTSLDLSNVETIGDAAFYRCYGLTGDLTIPNTTTSIGSVAFSRCNFNGTLTIGSALGPFVGAAATQGPFENFPDDDNYHAYNDFSDIVVSSSNTTFDSRNSCKAIIKTSTNTLVYGCKNTTIPNTVVSIGYSAFYYCTGLSSIIIPSSVTSIEGHAFYLCAGLTTITIPELVSTIGDEAFCGCTGITSMTVLPETPPTCSQYTFADVNKSIPVTVPCDKLSVYQSAQYWSEFTNYQSNNFAPGALPSAFSIANGKQICFSQGNLQYQASTHTWRFAENQYDYVGSSNNQISSSYNGWIDLFGWGTSSYNHGAIAYQPWSTSTTNSDYYAYGSASYNLYDQTGQADWGYNAIYGSNQENSGWRTLTKDEWYYLFNTRSTSSGKRYAKAQVNGVNGVILLPDDWKTSYFSLSNTNTASSSYTGNTITTSQWTTLEQHGAVFLPTAGYRSGTTVNNVSSNGYYWSSSGHNADNAYMVYLTDSNLSTNSTFAQKYGQSVRLVHAVTFGINCTCNPTEGGVVSGTGAYPSGSECTLTATASTGYHFVNWTEGGSQVSTSASYSFTVTGARTLVANFEEDAFRFINNGNWNTASNWQKGALPGADDIVIIEANCNLNQNATVTTLTVTSGYSLTIKTGYTLNVTGTLTNTTAANLIIEDGAQLITSSSDVAATVKKHINAWTTTPNVGNWYFIASPVATNVNPTTVTNMITASQTFDLYRFDGSKELGWENYVGHTEGFYLVNGQGYLYANETAKDLEFSGVIKAYDASYAIATPNTWCLVGNPYTFGAYVNRKYYKMDEYGTAVTAVNDNDVIMPCTGILVNTNDQDEPVIFSKEAAVTSANNGNLELTLTQAVTNTRGEKSVQTLDNAIVSFSEGSELGKFYFGTQNANIYIPKNGKEYAIVSVEAQGEMPVCFKAAKDGQYTITVNTEEVEMGYLHLIDNIAGTDIDLLATSSYSFNAKADDYESRFRLVFSANNENQNENENDFAFISNDQLIITGEGTLQIIDMMGRILVTKRLSTTNSQLPITNFRAGVYVLRLINGENVKTQKIVVK